MTEQTQWDFDDDDRAFNDAESPGPGCFHMVVQDVVEGGGKNNDQLVVDFVVLSPGEYQGLVYKDYIPQSWEDWARKKRYKLAIVLGMTTIADLKKGGVVLDWNQAIGRECAVELVEDHWTDAKGNTRTNVKAKWPDHYIALSNTAALKKRGCVLQPSARPADKAGSQKPAAPAEEDPFS